MEGIRHIFFSFTDRCCRDKLESLCISLCIYKTSVLVFWLVHKANMKYVSQAVSCSLPDHLFPYLFWTKMLRKGFGHTWVSAYHFFQWFLHSSIKMSAGRAVAQAVSRWLTTAATRFRVRAARGFCGGQSGTAAGFLPVLLFPLPIIPPFLHNRNHLGLAQ
jgi:hypothetical protein